MDHMAIAIIFIAVWGIPSVIFFKVYINTVNSKIANAIMLGYLIYGMFISPLIFNFLVSMWKTHVIF